MWEKNLCLILIFLIFVACQNGSKKAETVQVVPSDTIPMQYRPNYPNFRMPILDAIMNDSIHVNVFFDTGATSYQFFSDSLKNLINRDSVFLQIGKIKKQIGINFEKNYLNITNRLGKNTILVGWKFFENKIIEFDFQNQRFRVYDELPDITGYSKIKIKLSNNSKLLIPAQVVIQGKTIEANVIIDTGSNDFVVLSANRIKGLGIDTTNTLYEKSTVSGGLMPSVIISADTIKVGDLYIANQNMQITFDYFPNAGLLGTKTLENFSVILDLINYDLYLKKIDK